MPFFAQDSDMKRHFDTLDFLEKNILWLFAIAMLILFVRLGAAPVYILDEAKNAQCAREMLEKGNLIVPLFNGELRTDKPALHYWFMAFSYKMFGVGAWQARLFSAIMGLILIVATWGFTRKWMGDKFAALTSALLIISIHLMFEFRLAVPDPYLITFTALGLYSAYNYTQLKSLKWLLFASLFLALATLAKGPVALGLPGVALLIFIISTKAWWVLKDYRILLAAALYGIIVVPWFWAVHIQTDGVFTNGFFFDHNLNRFSAEMEGHGGPFFLPLLFVILGFLPFSLNMSGVVKSSGWRNGNPLLKFSIIIALVYIVFFGFSRTKLPNYPMPSYPFVAIIIAFVLFEYHRLNKKWPLYALIILAVIAMALPVGGYYALRMEPALKSVAAIAFGLSVLFFFMIPVFVFRQFKMQALLKWLIPAFLILNAYFLWIAYPAVYKRNPITNFQQQHQIKDVLWLVYKQYNPALNFNAAAKGEYFTVSNRITDLENVYKVATKDSLKKTILIISRRDHAEELLENGYEEIYAERDLFELPETVILKKRSFNKN